jgi:hypothetical protein
MDLRGSAGVQSGVGWQSSDLVLGFVGGELVEVVGHNREERALFDGDVDVERACLVRDTAGSVAMQGLGVQRKPETGRAYPADPRRDREKADGGADPGPQREGLGRTDDAEIRRSDVGVDAEPSGAGAPEEVDLRKMVVEARAGPAAHNRERRCAADTRKIQGELEVGGVFVDGMGHDRDSASRCLLEILGLDGVQVADEGLHGEPEGLRVPVSGVDGEDADPVMSVNAPGGRDDTSEKVAGERRMQRSVTATEYERSVAGVLGWR